MASISSPVSLARLARPIHGEYELEQLLDLVAQARIVVLGSASYGTHEHYDLRASLTRKLIAECGFAAVVVEADWPDALRVDRYVRHQTDDEDAGVAMSAFEHFPAWAWRNEDVARLVEWVHAQNYARRAAHCVGFYGLDLYSLNAAMRAMRTHLDVTDEDLIAELCDMQWRHAARSGRAPSGEAWLHAMQKTTRMSQSRAYYRALLAGGAAQWNQRAAHMADTVDMVASRLGTEDDPGKIVVWAHNAQAGDARALLDQGGRSSLGQVLRERHPDEVALVGFTTYEGTVLVAPEWDEPGNSEPLPPSHAHSWEALFHETGEPRFMITASALRRAVGEQPVRLHRGIGAIMRSNPYVTTRLADQYDVIVHVDTTRAVEPLRAEAQAAEAQAMTGATVHAG